MKGRATWQTRIDCKPSAKIVVLLDALADLGQLEALAIRLLHVKTWEELLDVRETALHPRWRRMA